LGLMEEPSTITTESSTDSALAEDDDWVAQALVY
jgi:hypothetical protein